MSFELVTLEETSADLKDIEIPQITLDFGRYFFSNKQQKHDG